MQYKILKVYKAFRITLVISHLIVQLSYDNEANILFATDCSIESFGRSWVTRTPTREKSS